MSGSAERNSVALTMSTPVPLDAAGRLCVIPRITPRVRLDASRGFGVQLFDLRDRPRLPIESVTKLRIGRQLLRQDLDCDGSVETGIAGLVDLAHATGDCALDLIDRRCF